MVIWTERNIGRQLAFNIFNNKCLVVVPNCNWTGNECDILAVTKDLRIIDVEIKISRADLKADAEKDKWYHFYDYRIDGPYKDFKINGRRRRDWPKHVWKHYYALPESIWKDDLKEVIQPNSGILLLKEKSERIELIKRAKPNRQAKKLDANDAIDLARLASLRMWNAYNELSKIKLPPSLDNS